MKKHKIVLMANDTTYAYNLRREVIQRLVEENFDVAVVCAPRLLQEELKALGCRLISVETRRNGTNPFADLTLFTKYLKILHAEKPDTVLSYNIKPNVYGGMACQMLGIRYMPNITGLGTAVENPGKLQKLTIQLYKMGVAGAECVFFQNSENEKFFRDRKMLNKKSRTVLLPGSGVSLEKHQVKAYPQGDIVNFLYVARMLKEKGIDLYLASAKKIHDQYPNTIFHICGGCDDPKYLEIVNEAEVNGYIRYHGEQEDMIPFFEMANCIVHPSYYPEGMSNVLQEAAASGRPIIATDRSGCRETVDPGISGYLIPIKDEEALVEALEDFMNQSWEARREMGLAGRRKMEREFDREIVVKMVTDEVCSCVTV